MDSFPGGSFRREDETADEAFYTEARLVTHIDAPAIAVVTNLYREYFPPGGAILDLMSSWVSHLPPEVSYREVVGVGLNAEELVANPRLTEWRVQNLNTRPALPFGDAVFDGAAICVSVQYLTQPVRVFREVARVLVPGAPLVVTFSNRCFPTKAVAIWQRLDDTGHGNLVQQYFAAAGTWTDAVVRAHQPPWGDPLYAVIARRAKRG